MTGIEETQAHQELVKKTARELVKPVFVGSAYLATTFRNEVLLEVVDEIYQLIDGASSRLVVPDPDAETVRLD